MRFAAAPHLCIVSAAQGAVTKPSNAQLFNVQCSMFNVHADRDINDDTRIRIEQ
jgi:hypothetical protein